MLVETGDLLRCCPIWEFLYGPGGVSLELFYFRRVRAIREAWSHKILRIAPPCHPDILVREYDGMTYSQWFFRSRCKTLTYWKVTGPDALMAELAEYPYNSEPGARHLNLYLCQHEICGD